MAILSKDGSVYTINSPNPLVKKQEKWDLSKLVFHNFNWDEIRSKVLPRTRAAEPAKMSRPLPASNPSPPEPAKEDKPHEDKTEDEPSEDKPEDNLSEPSFDLPLIKYKTISHCLPAIVTKNKDSLYGDSWERIKYASKIVFPSVVTNSTDFSLEFWTSDPKMQITEKSIIYPFSYEVHNPDTNSYDRVPYDEYRWWKVMEKEQKEGGWLFRAVPSEIQPDFSG
jgi:hypothetical protein